MNQTTYEDIVLESDVYDMISRLDKMEAHIVQNVPAALLYTASGTPNVYIRWGAVLYHLQYMRATLRSFL